MTSWLDALSDREREELAEAVLEEEIRADPRSVARRLQAEFARCAQEGAFEGMSQQEVRDCMRDLAEDIGLPADRGLV